MTAIFVECLHCACKYSLAGLLLARSLHCFLLRAYVRFFYRTNTFLLPWSRACFLDRPLPLTGILPVSAPTMRRQIILAVPLNTAAKAIALAAGLDSTPIDTYLVAWELFSQRPSTSLDSSLKHRFDVFSDCFRSNLTELKLSTVCNTSLFCTDPPVAFSVINLALLT